MAWAGGYYNVVRTHLALGSDAPKGRAVQRSGNIIAIPIISGLHHHYVRTRPDMIFGKEGTIRRSSLSLR